MTYINKCKHILCTLSYLINFAFTLSAMLNGSELEEVIGHSLINVGSQYEQLGPMKSQTVVALDEFYDPFVHMTADILKDKRFLWKDTYNSTSIINIGQR